MSKKKKKSKSSLQNKLNALRTEGRRAAARDGKKPFFFSGKRKKRKSVSRKKRAVVSSALAPIIFKTGEVGMSKKRKRYHGKKRASRYGGELFGRKHKGRGRCRSVARYGVDQKAIVGQAMEGVGVVGGVLAGSFIGKAVPVKNTKIQALVPVAAGVGLSLLKFGKRGLGKNIALGMVAVGMLSLIRQLVPSLPLLSGDEMALPLNDDEQTMLGLTTEGEQYEGVAGEIMDMSGENFVSAENVE